MVVGEESAVVVSVRRFQPFQKGIHHGQSWAHQQNLCHFCDNIFKKRKKKTSRTSSEREDWEKHEKGPAGTKVNAGVQEVFQALSRGDHEGVAVTKHCRLIIAPIPHPYTAWHREVIMKSGVKLNLGRQGLGKVFLFIVSVYFFLTIILYIN